MPKKKVNGFFIFMRDMMAKEEKKGRKMTMAQAQSEAGKMWPRLSEQEKSVYHKKAKNESCNPKESEKYTSQGVPLSIIEKERREKDTEERLMKKHIEDTVKTNFINNTLPDQKFYFIMANYFTKNNERTIYLPAEIAISEYTISEGVINRYHSYINPGVGMFGHAYDALSHSQATHQLPVPPNAMGEKNLERIYLQILKFIEIGDTNSYPPIYTHKESVPIVKSVLNYLSSDGSSDYPEIKIFPMHYLFFTLKNATAEIGENIKPASIHITDTILDRDKYEYEREISCDFHEKNDCGKYCALSCVVRWTFTFSENLCPDLAIKMIPGRHVPINLIPVNSSKIMSTTSSIRDDQSVISFNFSSVHPRDLTEPKLEREDWETSTYSMSECNFPALGSRKSKKQFANVSANNSSDDDDDDDHDNDDDSKKKKLNPWAMRSKAKPKAPACDESFSFSKVGTGYGRGIIRAENCESEYASSSSIGGGYGRGRFFK